MLPIHVIELWLRVISSAMWKLIWTSLEILEIVDELLRNAVSLLCHVQAKK